MLYTKFVEKRDGNVCNEDGWFVVAECPPAEDGFDRFACPSPDRLSRYKCIDAHALCDGFIDCPHAEDEDRMACMFYKTVSICYQPV
jgi:hypothetical protein